MKKVFAGLSLLLCRLFMYACGSSGGSSSPTPPAPKPDSYMKTAALAAKKADYYIRLAFDLADGYLSKENVANTNSVASRRYGDDKKYANSLSFTSAKSSGKISQHLGGFEFWYLRANSELDPGDYSTAITDYEGIDGNTTNLFKRDKVVSTANSAAWSGAKRYELRFVQTDTPGEILFDIEYSTPGAYTSRTTLMRTASINFTVEDSTGTKNPFTVTITNLTGKIHPQVSYGHVPSANDLFVIETGNVVISGTDPDTGVQYTINLVYSNDEGTGRFENNSGSFGAVFTAQRKESYYILDGDSTVTKHYILWDYPL